MECSFGQKSPMQMNAKKWVLSLENSSVIEKANLDRTYSAYVMSCADSLTTPCISIGLPGFCSIITIWPIYGRRRPTEGILILW